MSITVHEFDGITRQFRIKPHEMPVMSTPTMTPNYTSIKKFEQALRENALAVSSYQTHLGHLSLVVSPEEYKEVANDVPFVIPTNPGLYAEIASSNKAQIEVSRQFTFDQNEFVKYQATTTALRNLILNAIDEKYIRSLRHDISSYANVKPYDLLKYIWSTYGKIDDADHTLNEQRMRAPWSPPTPIETLFDQLEEGQEFAAQGNEIIDNSQLMRWAYDNIKATGLFDKDCERWRKRPPAVKQWTAFKTFFIIAEDDRKKNNPSTEPSSYSANQVQQLIQDELESILAESAPPSLIESSTTSTSPSSAPPATASANAAVTADEVRSIIKEALRTANYCPPASSRPSSTQPRSSTTSGSVSVAQAFIDGTPVSYCWSHGVTKNLQHTSQTCARKKEGHQDDATFHDRKGGSDFTLNRQRS